MRITLLRSKLAAGAESIFEDHWAHYFHSGSGAALHHSEEATDIENQTVVRA
jgi:hypothetical protein